MLYVSAAWGATILPRDLPGPLALATGSAAATRSCWAWPSSLSGNLLCGAAVGLREHDRGLDSSRGSKQDVAGRDPLDPVPAVRSVPDRRHRLLRRLRLRDPPHQPGDRRLPQRDRPLSAGSTGRTCRSPWLPRWSPRLFIRPDRPGARPNFIRLDWVAVAALTIAWVVALQFTFGWYRALGGETSSRLRGDGRRLHRPAGGPGGLAALRPESRRAPEAADPDAGLRPGDGGAGC